jgi:hypothetical protein
MMLFLVLDMAAMPSFMPRRPTLRLPAPPGAPIATASGAVVGLAGLGLVAAGLWGRREVARALARERVVSTADAKPPNAPVRTAAAARSLSEVIRDRTLAAADGRTYAETDEFLAADGTPTSDPLLAHKDESGRPIENPQHALWLQAMTLQTALMQAYVSGRIADLTVALGVALTAAGAGIAAAGAAARS